MKVYRQFPTVLCARDAYPQGMPRRVFFVAKIGENPFTKFFCEYKSMPANGTELPVYHLKHIAAEPQRSGTMREEAPTQISDIRQHSILYQNACEW